MNMLLEKYMNSINRPYNSKTIYGNATDATVRNKYLLRELPNETIKDRIVSAIIATGQDDKMVAYEKLTAEMMKQIGGFTIDGFKSHGKIG